MAKSHGKEVSITEALTKELMEELNCNTVFTIPAFGGIKVPESVVVTWIIMALLILLSILLTRNLSIDNPGKVQLALESGYQMAESFFGELLGANGLKYLPYLLSVLLYIAVANLIGLIGFKPPTKDMGVTAAMAVMSIVLVEVAGIRQKGTKGWLKGFLEPIWIVAPINLLEVLTRPLSRVLVLLSKKPYVHSKYPIKDLYKCSFPQILHSYQKNQIFGYKKGKKRLIYT